MKTIKVLSATGIFCLALALTNCNNPSQEHHSTDVDAAAANAKADSTAQVSKDSVTNKTPVSPTEKESH